MSRLRSSPKWELLVPRLKYLRQAYIMIQSLNINSLDKHYKDLQADYNLQASHILCLQETKVKSIFQLPEILTLSKYKYISIFDGHGSLLLYDNYMVLHSYETKIHNGSEYITSTFNVSTRRAIHVISVYKSHSTSLIEFLNILDNLISKAPQFCPLIIVGDFNVDMLQLQTRESSYLLSFMQNHKLTLQIKNSTTKGNSLLNHVWTNSPGNFCKVGIIEAYWPDYHKPIYFAFKLPNHMPRYNREIQSSTFT
jgi:exonuclease III